MKSGTFGERVVISRGAQDTQNLARALARSLPRKATLALHGELGSGKTCFVKGLAAALGIRRTITSPTFTMINEYRGALPLYHIDLYRLARPDDVLALGFLEYIEADGVKAIEWAERAGDLLDPAAIHVWFEPLPDPDARRITIRQGSASRTPHNTPHEGSDP
jgi:tRNA threonylcarbamoyladenosine biosynthesis protein TsaE